MLEPAFGERDWQQARRELAACSNLRELRQRMAAKAREMGNVARKASDLKGGVGDPRQFDREFWQHLGVSVVDNELSHSGGHHEGNGTRLIFVRASEHRWRKRFTAAHEIAHFLLDDLRDTCAHLLDADKEERLCDDFASELLIPRSDLHRALTDERKLSPELVAALCRRFRVNLQPMLIALAGTGRFDQFNALLARRRGHPSRPDEIDYRVEKRPFRGLIFLPKDQRLRSLGLGDVVDWAATQDAGQRSDGRAEMLELPLWERGRGTGVAVGPASWQAQTLAGHELLVLIELTELHYRWHPPKKTA
jgi:hypothetical protein